MLYNLHNVMFFLCLSDCGRLAHALIAGTMYFDPKSEKEVSTRLRQLVDNCIEEGHYETAISNLDKLRSPTSRPSVCVSLFSAEH
jgi:hypothetical protein